MKHTPLRNSTDLETMDSFMDFLDAYPYTLEVHGDTLLVSSATENFTVSFNPLVIDDKSATLETFVARIAKGDDSVFSDWNTHAYVYSPLTELEKDLGIYDPMILLGID